MFLHELRAEKKGWDWDYFLECSGNYSKGKIGDSFDDLAKAMGYAGSSYFTSAQGSEENMSDFRKRIRLMEATNDNPPVNPN